MASCYETAFHRLGAASFPNDRVSRSPRSWGTPPIVAPRLPGHTMQRPEAHCSIAAVASRSPAAKAVIPCQRKLIKSAGAVSAARPLQQPEAVALPLGSGGSPQKAPTGPSGFSGSPRTNGSCGKPRPPTGQWCCERRPYPGASDGIRSAVQAAAEKNGMNGPEATQPMLNISLQQGDQKRFLILERPTGCRLPDLLCAYRWRSICSDEPKPTQLRSSGLPEKRLKL